MGLAAALVCWIDPTAVVWTHAASVCTTSLTVSRSSQRRGSLGQSGRDEDLTCSSEPAIASNASEKRYLGHGNGLKRRV